MNDVVPTVEWSLGSLLVLLAGMLVVYVGRWRGLRRADRHDEATAAQLARFAAGWLILLTALIGPLDWLAEQRLMSAHMRQHILLMSAAPALLLSALTGERLGELGNRIAILARPTTGWTVACLTIGVGAILALHVPSPRARCSPGRS